MQRDVQPLEQYNSCTYLSWMSNLSVGNLDDAPYFWSSHFNIDTAGCKDIIMDTIFPF